MALRQKRWRFGKKRSKHREVHVWSDATPFFAALSSRKKKKAAPHQVRDGPLRKMFLSQIAAEALDALAGIFEIGSFGRVRNPERRAEPERRTLHDGHAFVLQKLGD